MILTGFDIYQYRVPLVATLKLGGTLLFEREGLLVRLSSSAGAVGWGDIAPLPGFSRETLPEAREQIIAQREALRGWFITADWIEPEGTFVHHLDAQGLAPSVRFGLELALWNLHAAARRTSVAHLLASQPRTTVSLNGLLMGAAEDTRENAWQMREAGYQAVKLKVGRGALEKDVERVRTVSRVLGPSIGLRLDANRAWSLDEAAAFVRAIANVTIEYIEEPLQDPKRLPEFVDAYQVPVALDETLIGIPAESLGAHAYARAVILKPTLLGGLIPTRRLAQRAATLGMMPVFSASFETGVGLQGLVALAAALSPDDIPAGLDTYRWLADDVMTPHLDLGHGRLDVATVLGASRSINKGLLKEV